MSVRFTGGLCGLYDPVERTDFFMGEKMKPVPSFDQINVAFSYDPESGILTWKRRDNVSTSTNTKVAGKEAGYRNVKGYLKTNIKIDGVTHYLTVHRIAWILMTGAWPKEDVDHRDGVRDNNRWINLREATKQQNRSNSNSYKEGKFKGCHLIKETGRWRAKITRNGKFKCLGYYDTPEMAYKAYCSAAEEVQGEFAHHISRGGSFRP